MRFLNSLRRSTLPHFISDEMGLGKTVQMIATMAINLPEPEDTYRTTLIVVPAALMLQACRHIYCRTVVGSN